MYNNPFGGSQTAIPVRIAAIFSRIDYPLLYALLAMAILGLVILYSATGQNSDIVTRQVIHLAIGFFVLLLVAQMTAPILRFWSPWCYVVGLLLLGLVLGFGEVGQGAQRWLNTGLLRFQPSELMKLVMPMAVAWFVSARPLPLRSWWLLPALLLIALPCYLIALQPDLGTAVLIAISGLLVLFLAGLRWWVISASALITAATLPTLWHFMHDYQRRRVMTLLSPESDPLGAGYHIIQSKIAIGSGGIFGKGWLNGTQSQLNFLPESSTDFIFAVLGEELGFLGAGTLIALYLCIIARGLYISLHARGHYARLLGVSLSLTFFLCLLINIAMVMGLLPVVGVPLPLVSYGGTSIVTWMAGFGILMSLQTRQRRRRTQ